MVYMSLAMLLVPGMDTLAKLLGSQFSISPPFITMVRFGVQTILMGGVALFASYSLRISWYAIGINLVRGVLMGAAASIFFTAVLYMPVADAIAIFFVEPMIVMFMSAIFLGEMLGWRRIVAAIVGFCGAIFVIQPSFAQVGWSALLPIGTAFLFSVYLLLTRRFGHLGNPMAMQFYAGIGGVIFCSAAVMSGQMLGSSVWYLTLPTGEFAHWAIVGMISIGVLGSMGHFLVVLAFSRAPVAVLAPFQYLEIVSATLLGYLVFGDFPNGIKWFGISVIVGTGLYIFAREQKTKP